ncbi:ATP-binding protein [bacterium]
MALEMVLIEKIWMELLETAEIPCFLMDEHGQLIDGNDLMKTIMDCPSWQNIGQKNLFQQLRLNEIELQTIKTKLNQGSLAHHPIKVYFQDKTHLMNFTCRKLQVQVYDSTLYYGMLVDETEKEDLKQRWTNAQQTITLGQLTGEIIRDFNYLNHIIQTCAELIHKEVDDQNNIYNDLQAIRLAAQKTTQLTQKLLAYIKDENRSQTAHFSVNTQIRELLAIYKRFLHNNLTIKYHLEAENDMALGDPSLLDQAIMNLLVNAREAMPQGGTVTISTKNANMIKSMPNQKSFKIKPNRFICIQIQDTGTGISPELKKNIFQPSFTTKPQGIGLGLSIVEENIHNLNGRISVTSPPDRGATFSIFIPSLHN